MLQHKCVTLIHFIIRSQALAPTLAPTFAPTLAPTLEHTHTFTTTTFKQTATPNPYAMSLTAKAY